MKKLLLTLILVVVSNSVMAEWFYVGLNARELSTVFIDSKYIKHKNTVTILNLTKYAELQKKQNMMPYIYPENRKLSMTVWRKI